MNPIPFTGRRDALRFLWDQLHRSFQRGPGLLLLSAPAGAGKTALVRHFLDTIADSFVCATGRGWDNRAAVSYHALREAVLQLPGSREHPDPSIHSLLHGFRAKEGESLHPGVLFPALADFLHQRSREHPLCLFLDDLQWADEGTFIWLDYAIRQMEEAPILWIGAYRREEASSLASLLDRLREWYQTDRFREYLLEPLTRDEVEELTRQSIPESQWQEDLPDRIWERSEGLALLTVEEIRAHREGRQETSRGQALIAARLNRLSAEDRELLSVAAIVGERFDLEPLTAALNLDTLDLARRLEQLRREQGLLDEDGAGFRFTHSRYREALLADMSQAVRQAYHARLTQQNGQLTPAERTFHLAHSGDAKGGIRALLAEGDQTIRQSDWRDALRYYMEALWLAQTAAREATHLFLAIYQRLGDLQLEIGQHVIARTYYEAARCWARTPREQVLLFCRLAETCRGKSPGQWRYLDEATSLLSRLSDPDLHHWVLLRQITSKPAQTTDDWPRIAQLCKALRETADLPEMLIRRVDSWRIQAAIRREDRTTLRGLERQLEQLPLTRQKAEQYSHLITACKTSGSDPREIIRYIRATRDIYETLGNTLHGAQAYFDEADTLLQIGAWEEARAVVREALRNPALNDFHGLLYNSLCTTWIHDRAAEGLEWATGAVEGIETFFVQYPTDGGHLRKLLYTLGRIERIFREFGCQEEFRQRVDQLRNALRAAGYRTDVTWYLGDPVALPQVKTAGPAEAWNRINIGAQNAISWQNGALTFRLSPDLQYELADIPRFARQLAGDFSLQATIHSGIRVLQDLLQCRRQQAVGPIPSRASGGGGLYIYQDSLNYWTLSAHSEPGQALFTGRREGEKVHLGRGLLKDTPLRLRLEKEGPGLRAYAGDEDGPWYSCGEVDLPGWERFEMGIFAENPGLYRKGRIEKLETCFHDIRLEGNVPRSLFTEASDDLYPLPEPAHTPDLPGIIAADLAMRALLDRIPRIARAALPVLILGETGTGKELVARALHRLGDRADQPFVPVNCAAIPAELLERELFGHVRGAYTGAQQGRGGLFEAAHGGLLFLDEIDAASPEFQTRLLRVIEEQAIRRVGDPQLRPIDVRILAATNRDLGQAIAQGNFRQDLYFRLKGMELRLPPLRERRDDIPHLVAHALTSWSQHKDIPCPGITRKAVEALLACDWPGNVRELLHAVERAAEEASGETITANHLTLQSPSIPDSPFPSAEEEYQRIHAALRETRGNISAAARRLGFHRNTLYRKMKQLGIPGR